MGRAGGDNGFIRAALQQFRGLAYSMLVPAHAGIGYKQVAAHELKQLIYQRVFGLLVGEAAVGNLLFAR